MTESEDVWVCEVCGKNFDAKEEAISHEGKCQESKLHFKHPHETVSMNEAIFYGFKFIYHISGFILIFIILNAVGYKFILDFDNELMNLIGIMFISFAMILLISIGIAIRYKTWVDILGRSRK